MLEVYKKVMLAGGLIRKYVEVRNLERCRKTSRFEFSKSARKGRLKREDKDR